MTSFDITSILVPATLWLLVAFSVVTWTLILLKGLQHVRAGRRNRRHQRDFWTAPDLQAAARLEVPDGPSARLAAAGFRALQGDDTPHDLEHSGDRQDLLERALRQQALKERRALESGLAVLASIGSTAPFVGLFGTVWGIMHALVDIGRTGSASLEVVAGPIGEALVATGVGIAVAVPAVLAYNYFLRKLKTSAADLDDFAADLITLARKTGFRLEKPAAPAAGVAAARQGLRVTSATAAEPSTPNLSGALV